MVLLIDDAPEIFRLAEKHLRSMGLEVGYARNGIEGLEIASNARPDLILLDYNMPDLDGLTLLRILKASQRLCNIPVVMVTAAEDQELVSNTFDSGAVDYVRKPFNPSELRARVMSALRTQSLIMDLQVAADTDSLTGLLNLRTLSRRISQRNDAALGSDRLTAIYYIDLDNFKVINDSLGHSLGDRMIIETARRLTAVVSEHVVDSAKGVSCEIARVGGDEFVVFVQGLVALSQIREIADYLLQNLNRQYQCGDRHFYSSASIGISHDVSNSLPAEQLILRADIALYTAKSAGKRCWRAFDEAMKHSFEERVNLESDLRKACERMDFHLVYQPIVQLKNNRAESVEALIRWDHRNTASSRQRHLYRSQKPVA